MLRLLLPLRHLRRLRRLRLLRRLIQARHASNNKARDSVHHAGSQPIPLAECRRQVLRPITRADLNRVRASPATVHRHDKHGRRQRRR
ncbi:MAG: hypothetical protein ACK4F6_19485, partial [Hylemonella sp.]